MTNHLDSNQPLVKTVLTVESIPGHQVTDQQVEEAAALFSAHYGVWGEQTSRAGQRVSLSRKRLRGQCLPLASITKTVFTRVAINGILAGHAFACRWEHAGKQVCWITQLVVHRNYRRHGVATTLLSAIRLDTDDIYGIMSSHPAACLAAAKAYSGCIEKVSLDYIATNANAILQDSPISYIRDAKPHGSLFDDTSEMVSGVNSEFFVDHGEPNEALDNVRKLWNWPLGDLVQGHEFLLIMQNRWRSVS